jgi:hypothetical protein
MKRRRALLALCLGFIFAMSLYPLLPRAAAQAKPEKFALLVGINAYQYVPKLEGCAQDVADLQGALKSKFEFSDNHILALTDKQATHDAIIATFKTHLIENARRNPNAIVIFAYSGHGSQVEDTNGDEPDGLDETLVTVDSRDPEGKNFDIIDDELDDLFEQLSRYTANITFILDSCHSGSATRGESTLDKKLVAREVSQDRRPQPKPQTAARPRSEASPRDEQSVDVLSRNERYVTLSGCESSERSFEEVNGERHNGAFTFHLVDALRRAGPTTTYREIMEEVARAVSLANPHQHPQIEGALDKVVFAGSATRETSFIAISQVEGRNLTIKAGAAQGVKAGALIAVYAPDARELVGETKKLTNATITKVDAFTSTAEMPDAVSVPEKSRVVLVAPNFNASRLRVALNDPRTSRLVTGLASTIQKSELLETVASSNKPDEPSAWDVTVMRGKFGAAFRDKPYKRSCNAATTPTDAGLPADTADVYYLAARDGQPLFGFFVLANDPAGAEKIAEALDKLAKQRSLRALSNEASTLKDKLKLTVWRVIGERDASGKFKITKEEPVTADQLDYGFEQCERFRLEIKNASDAPLHVALFDIATDGSIDLMYPPRGAREKLNPQASVKTDLFRTIGPAGYETFKIIATTEYVDYSLLRQAAVTRDGLGDSPLGALMSMAMGRTRGVKVNQNKTRLDQWATAQINFAISNQAKREAR